MSTALGDPAPGAYRDLTVSGLALDVVECRAVSRSFVRDGRTTVALEGVDLTVREGEFVALVGPSGCGKSTILNLIAGLQRPSAGQVLYRGMPTEGVNTRVGYMTQKDTLLPWRDVRANMAIPLEIQARSKRERDDLVRYYVRLVGLEGFESHLPRELSGGMRKRVALARTLIYEPETLLCDEPFGALDAQLKLVLQDELLRLWERRRATVVFVTHDLAEAITLADRVVLLSARPGHVVLVQDVDLARPRDVYQVRFTDRFGALHATLWAALESSVDEGRAA
jgi:NitT/TauT family transport system ATP-binding protein